MSTGYLEKQNIINIPILSIKKKRMVYIQIQKIHCLYKGFMLCA